MRNSLGQMRRLTIEEIASGLPQKSRLTIVKYVDDYIYPDGKRASKVLCLCVCGNNTEKTVSNLQNSFSCGCLLADKTRKRCQKFFPHIILLHHRYNGMMGRCYNPLDAGYPNYGGRGVRVCDEWKANYQNFLDWALANGWAPHLQLDKDIIGDGLLYGPDTCCWVTRKKNMSKTRRNIRFDYKGESLTLTEICEIEDMPYSLVYDRITLLGMSVLDALKKGHYKSGPRVNSTQPYGTINKSYFYMKKSDRELVFKKFNGKCAYSGVDLDDKWQIDHVEPKRSPLFMLVNMEGQYVHNKNDMNNLFPTCKILNHYKRGKDLEQWRKYLLTLHLRLKKLPKKTVSPTVVKRKAYLAEVASCFGISVDKPFGGVFYFETLKQ